MFFVLFLVFVYLLFRCADVGNNSFFMGSSSSLQFFQSTNNGGCISLLCLADSLPLCTGMLPSLGRDSRPRWGVAVCVPLPRHPPPPRCPPTQAHPPQNCNQKLWVQSQTLVMEQRAPSLQGMWDFLSCEVLGKCFLEDSPTSIHAVLDDPSSFR